ncbi:unnamed protein product, partial [Phaeothamnion confervicola]
MNPSSTNDSAKGKEDLPDVQGEGDYKAAHHYNDGVKRFVADHDIEDAARAAEPATPAEARELQEAER